MKTTRSFAEPSRISSGRFGIAAAIAILAAGRGARPCACARSLTPEADWATYVQACGSGARRGPGTKLGARRHSEGLMAMLRRHAIFAACAFVLAACSSIESLTPAVPLPSGSQVVTDPAGGATASPVAASAPGFVIETHARTDLENYSQFSFMTATTKGLAPDAAAKADERISGMIDAAVNDALAADDGACMEGEAKCGRFELTLVVLPCSGEFLCLKQDVNGVPVGSATSDQQVDVLVLDPATGRAVDFSRFVPLEATEGFLAAVNAEVAAAQQQAGFYDPAYPTEVTEGDIAGWAPLSDRIQIWFSRYAAGPGAMGAVTVSVPYPGGISSQPTPALLWRSLPSPPSDPVYVELKRVVERPDGSHLLTVDPYTPDLDAGPGQGCEAVYFRQPQDGFFCLANVTVRDREVTLLPDAQVFVGDSPVQLADLIDYVSTGPAVVFLYLDGSNYASAIVAYEPSTSITPLR